MKIELSSGFYFLLNEIIVFIALDKPIASRKFKKDLIQSIRKDLQFPYNYKKSIYFDDVKVRDYVFKGYTLTYRIDELEENVEVFGIIKNRNNY